MRRLADAGAADAARIDPARFASDRIGFLSELSLLAVPGGASPEAFGYQAIEALAAGLPVVLPAHGAFPEIAAAAGCGVLAPDNDPATLAAAWADLLADPRRLRDEASRGRAAARTRFSQAACAAGLERVLSKQVRPPFPAT